MNPAEKPQLKPANENPWYCLATLHGEQRGEEIDPDLAEKNRVDWDRWISSKNNEEQRAAINERFTARMGNPAALQPDPNQPVDFTHTHFETPFACSRFQFPRDVDSSSAAFSNYADFRHSGLRR